MFSFWFDGNLGDLLAPRPDKTQEIWKFLKNGLLRQALDLLRDRDCDFPLNELDTVTGMAPLHYASACGNVELMVEMIAQGATVNLPDRSDNIPLHYAAANNRLGALELLLHSGGDQSRPNDQGLLPVELCRNMRMRQLFLSEELGQCTPRAQAKALFSDYLQLHAEQKQAQPPSPRRPETEPSHNPTPSVAEPPEGIEDIEEPLNTPKSPPFTVQAEEMIAIVPTCSAPSSAHNAPQPFPSLPDPFNPTPCLPVANVPLVSSSLPVVQEASLSTYLLQAARETAATIYLTAEELEAMDQLERCCRRIDEKLVRRLLSYDPSLPMQRLSDKDVVPADGRTFLHMAAFYGNVAILRLFQELGRAVSFWVRDLRGRTPLHYAALRGHSDACQYLREQMRAESQKDPVGTFAPLDFAGSTPLALAKSSRKGRISEALCSTLFEQGDASVLPATPFEQRTGKTPWKLGHRLYQKENVIYGCGEAPGWTLRMEDRTAVLSPLHPRHQDWSLFAIFDGHGGWFTSNFLAERLPVIVAEKAAALPVSTEITPELLQRLLTESCGEAEQLLRDDPRMIVHGKKRLSCLDSSGSTAVVALVTSFFVVVGNVGDSRAVLARRSADAPSIAQLTTNPFALAAVSKDPDRSPSPAMSPPSPPRGISTCASSSLDLGLGNFNGDSTTVLQPLKRRGRRRNSSRCALEAMALSTDHKVNLPAERERVVRAGADILLTHGEEGKADAQYTISCAAMPDIRLSMSRSFGDFYLKSNEELAVEEQAVIAVPEVVVHRRSATDAFLVLACDGIWDVMSNQDVVDFVGESMGFTAFGGPPGGILVKNVARTCDLLMEEALRLGSEDNLSAVVVFLGAPPPSPSASPLSQEPLTSSSKFNKGPDKAKQRLVSELSEVDIGVMLRPRHQPPNQSHSPHNRQPEAFRSAIARRQMESPEGDEVLSTALLHSSPLGGGFPHSNPLPFSPTRPLSKHHGRLNSIFDEVEESDHDSSFSPLNTAKGASKGRRPSRAYHDVYET